MAVHEYDNEVRSHHEEPEKPSDESNEAEEATMPEGYF